MRRLPNAISLLRALAFIPVMALIGPDTAAVALILFSLAALTDAVDGALARRMRATSALGAFLDPLADKVLVLGTLGGLLARGAVDPVPVGIVLLREIAVTGVRAFAAGHGVTVASNAFGKAKAGLQGTAVGGQILALAWPALGFGLATDALLWGAALVTAVTGAEVVHRALAGLAGAAGAVRAHAR